MHLLCNHKEQIRHHFQHKYCNEIITLLIKKAKFKDHIMLILGETNWAASVRTWEQKLVTR